MTQQQSPLKRRFTTRSLLGRDASSSLAQIGTKGLAALDINAAPSSPTAFASNEDVYKLGREVNDLRRELSKERAAHVALQAKFQIQTPVGDQHLLSNGLPRPRRPSTRSSSSLRHSTASSASNSSAVTPDDETSIYISSSAALPRSKGNLSLSQSAHLDRLSSPSSPASPMLANHAHGASLSKIPKFAVGMNRTLTGTHYDVSRSKSPLPEFDLEEEDGQNLSMVVHEQDVKVEDGPDVFAVPALPDPQMTPSKRNVSQHSRVPSSASRRRSIIPVSINSPAPLMSSQSSASSATSQRSLSSSQSSARTAFSPTLPFAAATTPMTASFSKRSSDSQNGNAGGRGKGGVFFASTDAVGARHAARVQSAASGTGKVLSELQIDLSTVRGALETTKNQLRVSSRANEHLLTQLSDVTDTRDALRTQVDALDNMLKRNERALAAMTERANAAEGQVERDRELMAEQSARNFELKERCQQAEDGSKKAEQAYDVLKTSMQAIGQGVRADVLTLRKEMAMMEERHAKELADARSQQKDLSDLLSQRKTSAEDADSARTQLQQIHQAELQLLRGELAEVVTHLATQTQLCQSASDESSEVAAELARIRRLMREHAAAE